VEDRAGAALMSLPQAAGKNRLMTMSLPQAAGKNRLMMMTQLARAYKQAGRLQESLVLLEKLLDVYTAAQEDDEEILEIRMTLANTCFDIGRRDVAVRLYESAYHRLLNLRGKKSGYVWNAKIKLANMYMETGRGQKAFEMLQEVLEKSCFALSRDHYDILIVRTNLALAHNILGQPGAGIPLLVEAIELGQRSG